MKEIGYDYVIVGGGSAGCVLAARLSENPAVRILLLEAGGRDTTPYIHMPVGFAKMTFGPLTWGLKTAPQRHAYDREIPYPQAKIIGGGSSINAQIYTRGHAADFDRWEREEGATGWSFQDVLPYFMRAEGNTVFSDERHGTDGPLTVSDLQDPQLISRAFVQACQELGMPYNSDFNGKSQQGAGIYQTTIRGGRRCSAAVAYLKPATARPNLTIELHCDVQRILFENRRATGVTYLKNGQLLTARADEEILVTSGAIGSPKIMMLSGIGPAAHLKSLDIDVIEDLPGVGENLNDHFGVDIVAELKGPMGLDRYKKPHWMIWAGLQYLLFRSGPVTSNVVEGGAFWFSDRSLTMPDLQLHFLAGAGVEVGVPTIPSGSGITLSSYTLRPKSRGWVRLASSDPRDNPIINPNFLAEPDDLRISIEGVRMSREIFSNPSLRKFIKCLHVPNDDVRTRAQLGDYVRRNGHSAYHPVGTCKIGADRMAVVDPQLRVRGLERIRICDSSTFPSLIGSNTNATAIMIGEKVSDLILGR